MDPDNGRESAYTSRLCKAFRCITAASSALLTNISPISLPNVLLILLHPPFRLGPLCLLQRCIQSDGVVAVDDRDSIHSKTDQMPHAPEHGHAAIVSVCPVW
ncbi:hypothetical protein BD311DRAFT_771326 [Dichomitus squalens]|uniref:Uncharacterized protein n=1 Tax=Dichomitus squalens TaxID=114155 RepID=A0A4V2JYP5_9APHY|nr:hypothetical protein BD311DRAFT_771326 [Dichomitus squalens]